MPSPTGEIHDYGEWQVTQRISERAVAKFIVNGRRYYADRPHLA